MNFKANPLSSTVLQCHVHNMSEHHLCSSPALCLSWRNLQSQQLQCISIIVNHPPVLLLLKNTISSSRHHYDEADESLHQRQVKFRSHQAANACIIKQPCKTEDSQSKQLQSNPVIVQPISNISTTQANIISIPGKILLSADENFDQRPASINASAQPIIKNNGSRNRAACLRQQRKGKPQQLPVS